MKRQPTEHEEKTVNNIFDKGFTSKMDKELMQLNHPKTTPPKKIIGRRPNIFPKNIHRWPMSLVIREMHSRATVK